MNLPHHFDMNDYQTAAVSTAIYDRKWALVYPALGLAGEAGEVAEKVKKMLRDGDFDAAAVASELGDVLWYLSVCAHDLGYTLDEIAQMNIKKLQDRKERNVLKGNGDNR